MNKQFVFKGFIFYGCCVTRIVIELEGGNQCTIYQNLRRDKMYWNFGMSLDN